jgi:phosphoglycolate phosphatase-like HAD superfamily hydrolase
VVSHRLRPAFVCEALLAALESAEGRRKQRKRDQTPDSIGLDVKRRLLEHVVSEDPEPDAFEAWLMDYVNKAQGTEASGATATIARTVLDEWRLAHTLRDFAQWLEQGAPSEDSRAAPGADSDLGRLNRPWKP